MTQGSRLKLLAVVKSNAFYMSCKCNLLPSTVPLPEENWIHSICFVLFFIPKSSKAKSLSLYTQMNKQKQLINIWAETAFKIWINKKKKNQEDLKCNRVNLTYPSLFAQRLRSAACKPFLSTVFVDIVMDSAMLGMRPTSWHLNVSATVCEVYFFTALSWIYTPWQLRSKMLCCMT